MVENLNLKSDREEKAETRFLIIEKIEETLEKKCRPCDLNNPNSSNCRGCPVLIRLTSLGKELGSNNDNKDSIAYLTPEEKRIAASNGLNLDLVTRRIFNGMAVEDAIVLPINFRSWTVEENNTILKLRRKGLPWKEIAEKIKRPIPNVKQQYYRLNKKEKGK